MEIRNKYINETGFRPAISTINQISNDMINSLMHNELSNDLYLEWQISEIQKNLTRVKRVFREIRDEIRADYN
jgi:hypothetical protein